MMTTELVPVQMIATKEGEEPEIIWQNKMVNSPFGLCPLRFKFEKAGIHKPCGHGRGEGGLPNVHITT